MLEKLTFKNNEGTTFVSGDGDIYANYSDLHDYLWNYETTDTDKISQFTRGVVKKKLPLVILCSSEKSGISVRNKLMEIADKDVLTQSPGKIYINDYYLECYIIGSTKSNYLYSKQYMEIELTILTDNPVWTKESTTSFYATTKGTEGETIDPIESGTMYEGETLTKPYIQTDYPYDYLRPSDYSILYAERDYPYEFYSAYGKQVIENDSYKASNFEMVIYGYVANPSILIGDHIYTVETTIYEGERVVINSRNKTIIKIDAYGNETNIYNSRGKEYSVFQTIPTGTTIVSWSGDWGFDITLYNERSEPEWSL